MTVRALMKPYEAQQLIPAISSVLKTSLIRNFIDCWRKSSSVNVSAEKSKYLFTVGNAALKKLSLAENTIVSSRSKGRDDAILLRQ